MCVVGRITNDARDTIAFSWLRTVTVRLGDTKVSLLQKMRVKVISEREREKWREIQIEEKSKD